jgi:hypothetical protein
MKDHNLNNLEMLKAYARGCASGASEKMPSDLMGAVMLANNRLLAAAIIENGGKLGISSNSVHEMPTTASHVVAVAAEDGSLAITLASKDEIIGKTRGIGLKARCHTGTIPRFSRSSRTRQRPRRQPRLHFCRTETTHKWRKI